MKVIFKFVIVAALCVGSAGVALGAPTFDIDFYGGSTSLAQGTYDTGADLSLAAGESVSVDVIASGFDPGDGLSGWALRLDYGSGLDAANLGRNANDWPFFLRQPDIQDGYLTVEGMASIGTGIDGDNLLLFSFDLTSTDGTIPSVLTLWDFDQGGVSTDIVTVTPGNALDGQFPIELAEVNATANAPIPATLWLLGCGISGLLAIRRRPIPN
jgi:hypothetical protein